MNARDNTTGAVERSLQNTTTMMTVPELCKATGMNEQAIRAELKALAGQGQVEHIPGRGRYGGRYGLIAAQPHADATAQEPAVAVELEIPAPQYNPDAVVSAIRAALPDGDRLMLNELAAAVRTLFLRAQGAAHLEREAEKAVGEKEELARQFAILKERHDSYEHAIAEIHRACSDAGIPEGHVATRAHKLAETVTTLRQTAPALAEDTSVDVADAATGYLVRVPKRRPRTLTKPEAARSAALSAARTAGRADVFALVPVGSAVRGAQWREA